MAIDDGVVHEISPSFYKLDDPTRPLIGAIAIRHRGGFIARYCEVETRTIAVHAGQPITAGQIIARVGQLNEDAMLHFELYRELSHASFRAEGNPFKRRGDLLNPTRFLDQVAHLFNMSHGIVTLSGNGVESVT